MPMHLLHCIFLHDRENWSREKNCQQCISIAAMNLNKRCSYDNSSLQGHYRAVFHTQSQSRQVCWLLSFHLLLKGFQPWRAEHILMLNQVGPCLKRLRKCSRASPQYNQDVFASLQAKCTKAPIFLSNSMPEDNFLFQYKSEKCCW